MADKKWSEFEQVKDLKGKDVDLLTIQKDNSYTNEHWDNKRVRLVDILEPIESKLEDLKTTILQIETGVAGLTTVGVKKPVNPWYNNTSDPEDEQLVELSIAKDLYKSVSKNESDIKTIEGDIDVIEQSITNINSRVSENKSNIDQNSKLLNLINNSYFHKGNIVSEIKKDDNPAVVPTSNAVYNFVEDVKSNISSEIDYETSRLWQKINNLDLKCIHFDDTAKDGQSTTVFELEDFVINKKDQKVFVVDSGHYYKELSLNRPEVLEIANKVVDWHNSNIKESYENDIYTISQKEAHPDFQGKYVGKTNLKGFNITNPMECELGVIPNDDCYLFVTRGDIPETDCYIIINQNTQCKKINAIEYVNFIDFIKPEYKNLFNYPIVIKVFWDEDNSQWRIDFCYNSYPSGNINFENINIYDLFDSSDNFYIKTQYFNEFYPSNSSEVFNDYKQYVPSEIDYFHSVHNLNNKFITQSEEQVTIQISSFQNETDTYAVICDSQGELNLLDYLGYSLHIPLNSKVTCKDSSIVKFEDCFNSPPKSDYYLIQKGCTNQDEGEFKPIITLSKYNVDGIYESFITTHTGTTSDDVLYGDGTDLKLDLLPITIENVTICSNFTEYDCYLNTKPSFITGKDNLCSRGNQFILGEENIPTDSVFIIGHPSNKVLNANTNCYENFGSRRDNIFEIDQDGLIFIKSPKNLQKAYDDDEDEILDLEYRCLQKILIDLNSKILELSEKNSELEIELSLLKNRIERLEEP